MANATIRDIARQAGVSIATVSRVVNNNYPVSDKTQHLVKKAMEELDYRPNANARSLRNRKTCLIALVIADLSNRFFMDAAKGLEAIIADSNYNLIIASSGGEIKKEQKLIDSLLEMRIAGLVIACIDKNPKRLFTCESMGVPVVLIDRKVESINTNQVLWDNQDGAYQLARHLIDCGHKRIAMVNVSLKNSNGQERLEGFMRALRESGISPAKGLISKSNFRQEEAYDFVMKVMNLPAAPTAIFCANNIMLEGTLKALRKLHLKVYDDVSVVVFGNPECNNYLDRRITAATQDTWTMGQTAGKVICDLLGNNHIHKTQIVLKTEIVFGESVKKI